MVGCTGPQEDRDRNALVVGDAALVRGLRPDQVALRALPVGGVIVTARADDAHPGVDVISRYFAPAIGIDEDPVTGAAHCTLAAYWPEALGRSSFQAEQVSGRGGSLQVSRDGAQVHLVGRAVTVMDVVIRPLPRSRSARAAQPVAWGWTPRG